MIAACQREGCSRPATVAPKVCVPAYSGRVGGGARLSSILTLTCCAGCFRTLRGCDFLATGDPGRERLRELFALQAGGLFLPDFDLAWVEPVELTSPDWLAIERAQAGREQ